MWSSIKDIYIPNSFKDAIDFSKEKNTAFFSGGTYLVSNKDNNIHKLIDINSLIDNVIEVKDDTIIIGAGVKIQEIVDQSEKLSKLSTVAESSNFSKNIRNQRTIGGEIAQRNIRSDMFTYLVALNPNLGLREPKERIVSLREWNGKGIINKIIINKNDIASSGFERYSLIPSSPAFLMVAVVRRASEIDFVVSGKAEKIFGYTMQLTDFNKNKMKSIINSAVKYFKDDHYGSIEYKKLLVATGIQRAVEQI